MREKANNYYFSVEDLGVELGTFKLEGVSFSIEEGDYLSIIGPTGAGKTILLETIAGIYKPQKGRVILNGIDITGLPPQKRRIGIIYQDYGLFPHLNVFENIAYGLKKKDIKKVKEIAELLGIEELLLRLPQTLSGGEKQRVALGRALIVEPKLLLMDEPFSALDVQTRIKIRNLIKEIKEKLSMTVIHITHDLDDVWMLSNKVLLINNGKVVQFGKLKDIMHRPKEEFVANFVGTNILKGVVVERGESLTVVSIGGQLISSIDVVSDSNSYVDLAIRPENIIIFREKPTELSARNILEVEVLDYYVDGRVAYVFLKLGEQTLKATLTISSFEELKISEGKKVFIAVKATAVRIANEEE